MYNPNQEEQKIIEYWKKDKTFEKSVNERPIDMPYVFYDGPPFATGLPHYGHILASVIKDVVPRYWTMQGYRVRRRWGWDCHGLPIESLIEKELNISGKKDIEDKLGVDKFNAACRSKVLMYTEEWKKMVERIGRWVEFDNSYKTMDPTYMESVWWALKTIWDKGLIYEGRKVLMYCPHCETPVSKAEIAMDNSYKDITEEAVTVKFKVLNPEEHNLPKNSFILAWTTTPWTLPGNVALAVGDKILYSAVEFNGGTLVVAEDLVERIFKGKDHQITNSFPGNSLVGIKYEPLFDMPAMKNSGAKKVYEVVPADFVNTEEGTGVVHTAVVYGEDDYNLGLKVGLPVVPMLNDKGEYNEVAPEWLRGKFIKAAEKEIKKYLDEKGLLFAKNQNTHSYPHCWRCETPLIYNAISAWFINIQKIKPRLIELNEKINWYPEHLKHGRFKNILETAPDWNISRNRYWATPLPFWKCSNEECSEVTCVGSVDELRQKTDRKITKLIFVRHGETGREAKKIKSSAVDKWPLTKKGEDEVKKLSENFEDQIDVIISSPVLRCKQTAEILQQKLQTKLIFDDLITEYNNGDWEEKDRDTLLRESKSYQEYKKVQTLEEKFNFKLGGGDSRAEITQRVEKFIKKINEEYQGKNVLVVSHGGINGMLDKILNDTDLVKFFADEAIITAGKQILYMDENGRGLDLHKHIIDQIKLNCAKCNGEMNRIPEVIDCWVESGSMPFAEFHYPFENKEVFKHRFPGQYIAEYINQTRAWFYYMHAMSGLLFDSNSFENCVTTGEIQNEKGEKLSKSKKNYPDPWIIIEKYGVDTLRYYLMTSPVMEAENLLFNEREIRDVYNKIINTLWNVVEFYNLYAESASSVIARSPEGTTKQSLAPVHVLDRWILAKLELLVTEVTDNMNNYNTVKAGRPIKDFIEELSTWYVRRSRDRFKSSSAEAAEDKVQALATLKYVLETLAKIMAPFTPFISEKIWQTVHGVGAQNFVPSIHLEFWPKAGNKLLDKSVLENMQTVRSLVELGLAGRAEAKIRIRQPLAAVSVSGVGVSPELQQIICDELNVKIVTDKNISGVKKENNGLAVTLDISLTPELKQEGLAREIIRTINQLRKEQKLTINDRVAVEFETASAELAAAFAAEAEEIKKSVLATSLKPAANNGTETEIDEKKIKITLTKV